MIEQKNSNLLLKFRKYVTVFFGVVIAMFCGLLTLASSPRSATAAASNTINFQARLMAGTGAIVPDGNYNVEFKLYKASSSSGSSQGSCSGDASCVWTETRTSANKVRTVNGYLTVELGSITALPSIDWSQNLYLTMNIGGTGSPGWDGEMSPRLHLTAVPHAFTADQLSATNGSNTATLGFTTPTASNSILLPDASGTVCLQNAASCGFALSSGAGSYIQNNQTGTPQSANIFLQNAGSNSTDSVTIKLGASQTGAGINVTDSSNQSIWKVSAGLVAQTVGLRLTVNSTTADTFTTPLGSSVKTAINIPLYNPGAFGQIFAFGIPSSAPDTARGISVFDNRSSGTIQPAIALFSPNENDVFGLSWNGLNTVASLETGSAAIALRPAGTNVKLWAGTTGVAIGSNVSSASYPLDVTGDVNTSTQYRIGGTVICTSSGCTPAAGSANYIQNTASAQSANMYVQAASSGSVAGVIRANAAGSGDILDLKNGAGTNVATFSSTGAILFQNSTNSTAALQISASAGAGGNSVLRVDTTNERVAIGVISDPIGAKLSVATSTTVGLRSYQGGSSDAFQLGNATADFLTVGSTGNLLLKPTTNSTTAFQIQNATGTSNLLFADTTNTRIAIAQASAAYTLDVAGDVNTTTSYRVAGTIVCDSTGCTAKSGSSFYIRNQATVQSANMFVQAASSGSVAAVLQANAAGSGDILDLKNGAGTNVATFSSTGAAAFRNSTNSTTAFQVQNASGGQSLNVSTSTNTITLNGTNSAALSTWQSTTSLNTSASFAASTISNGYAYVFGGYGSGYQTTVQYSRINPNGTMGTWATTTALPAARAYTAAAVSAGYIYVLGGTPTGTGGVDTIYVGKQSSDGVITAWQISNVVLPDTLNAMSVVVSGGYLYVVGGTNGSPVSSVYYAQINGDGSLDGFQSGTALPTALANAQTVASNGYIYYIGGYNGTSAVSTVYYSAINASTGANGTWTSTTALPSGHNNFGAVVSNGYLYAFKAGLVNYAPINTNGTIGSWTQDTNTIPVNYNGISALTYNGYNYVIGGYNGSVGTTGVYYTTGSRTYIAGTLDLVGLTMQGSGYGDDTGGNGVTGGALIAGNTTVMGTLQVQGQGNFAQNVAINGSLTVGNDTDSDESSIITVASRNFSGIHLLGDMGNGSGEVGGAYVLYAEDAWGTQAITGMVQVADQSPQGDTYTGALANGFLVGMYNNFAVQFGTNATVRMTIMNSGNVCVGVVTCTKKLGVSGTIGASGTITASTTPDLAETIPAAPDVGAADVVMADPAKAERVIKSNRAYNTAAIGVVSDGTSSFMINAYANQPDAPLTGKPVVLVGRVPVKVTSEGGSIRPGDLLTSASKPGYAMKATKAGPTIGTALGFFDGSEGTVLVFVNLGYHNPSSVIQGSPSQFERLNVSGNAVINNLQVNSVTVKGDASIQGSLTVSGVTRVGQIVVGGHIITQGATPALELQTESGEGAAATLIGNDTSGTISITIGANPAVSQLIKVLFAQRYATEPRVVVTPVGKESARVVPYIDYVTNTDMMIGVDQLPRSGTVLRYNYQIMQ